MGVIDLTVFNNLDTERDIITGESRYYGIHKDTNERVLVTIEEANMIFHRWVLHNVIERIETERLENKSMP